MTVAVMGILALACSGRPANQSEPSATESAGTRKIPTLDDDSAIDPSVREAFTTARQRVADNIENAESWGTLGRLYHSTEYLEMAREAYVQAAELDPDQVEWPYLIALLDYDRGRLESAAQWISRARSAAADDALTQRLAGYLLLQQNDLAGAAAVLTSLDQSDPATARALATVYLRGDQPVKAVNLLEDCVAGGANDRATLFLLATALQRAGRHDDSARLLEASQKALVRPAADQRLERVRQSAPGIPTMLRQAAGYLQQGDLERAIALYREVLVLNPGDFAATLNLANALGRQGKLDEALPLMQRAVEMRPDHPQPHLGLAMVYGTMGRVTDARAELEETLRIDPQNAQARQILSSLR